VSDNLVVLIDEELALLNGKCRPEIQVKVNAALERLSYDSHIEHIPEKYKDITRSIIQEAKTQGKLIYRNRRLRHCPVCDKRAGYATYTRNSRYHRKGEKNLNRPLTMLGIELASRVIRMEYHADVGMCETCWEELKPYLVSILTPIKAAIPEQITGVKPVWEWYPNRHCLECDWNGHEGELGKLPAIMGGHYPGQCPNCGARNNPLGKTIVETVKGFTLVKVQTEVRS
jgi:hypothetical protein